MAEKKHKIVKCLFPLDEPVWSGLPQPTIEGYHCIATGMIKMGKKHFELFEFIPDNLNLCEDGNAKREGNYIYEKN